MIRDNREYRFIPIFDVEKRAETDEETGFVEGYASTFDEYTLFEIEGIEYKERIEPTAFDGTDMSDVVFLKDHEGTVFARTKNGSITLSVNDHGLFTRTDLTRTSAAKQMLEEIRAEMYTQMSFAFVVDDDEYDERTHTRIIRHVKKIYDISAVSFPANYYTDISVATRSRFDGFIECERRRERERAEKVQRIKELLKGVNPDEV